MVMNNKIQISAIVASHRPQMIQSLLDGLDQQNVENEIFEVIVVADYPCERLSTLYTKVKFLFLNDRSISAKRNLGLKESTGEIVAFIDDDCVPDPNWLREALVYMENNRDCAAVEGRTTIEQNLTGIGMYRESKRLEKPGMRTNNIFYRRYDVLKAGGFDLRFTFQREDADLAFSVLENGGRIDYCEKIKVMHRFRHWERWDLLKNCWNRRFDPLLYKKHKKLYLKYIGLPISPSVLLLLGISLFYVVGPCLSITKKQVLFFHTLLAALLGLRRSGFRLLLNIRFFFETVSFFIAPVVVVTALIFGHFRFNRDQ